MPEEPIDADALVREIRRRVDDRRRSGEYPPGLEEELDRHFQTMLRLTHQRTDLTGDTAELDRRLDAVRSAADFRTAHIDLSGQTKAHQAFHRTVERVVRRQVEGVLVQQHRFATATIELLEQVLALLRERVTDAMEATNAQVALVMDHVAELALEIERQRAQAEQTLADASGAALLEVFGNEAFEAAFRGDPDELRSRYTDLADRFTGCDPVLDIGFGRGEFLELLRDRRVAARGIEIDPELVELALNKGLDARLGDASDHLVSLADGALGGAVLIQVVEHLPSGGLARLVRLLADKVRPGGLVVAETVNPKSLYVYTHAFYLDPTHQAPVHPEYLSFLFREAGFAEVAVEYRSETPADERLGEVDDDTTLGKQVNQRLDQLNAVLYGPQDYAVVARR